MDPLFLVSHHVHPWHNLLVVEPGRVTLAHRGTGARRTLALPAWQALVQVTRRPASEAACVAAITNTGMTATAAADEVRALIDERWLIERLADASDLATLDLGPPASAADLARDRLRWSRDALDTHALWLYPQWLGFPMGG